MVKTQKGGSAGSSKIRFVMLEADLRDGDLTEITQAISSALRQSPSPQRLISAPTRTQSEAGGNGASVDEPPLETDVEDVEEVDTSRTGKARPKFSNPKVLPEVDLNSGEMPFETFATQKGPPKKELQRYLIVAYWFKKYRNLDSITQDHVYTCYKKMGWGTPTKDFIQPLRDLASKNGRGEFKSPNFTINHIGEDAVEKMKAS